MFSAKKESRAGPALYGKSPEADKLLAPIFLNRRSTKPGERGA